LFYTGLVQIISTAVLDIMVCCIIINLTNSNSVTVIKTGATIDFRYNQNDTSSEEEQLDVILGRGDSD
jgi:hypothetical protein